MKKLGSRFEAWDNGAESPCFPGEAALSCPLCNSTDVNMRSNNLADDIIRNNIYTVLTCNRCGTTNIYDGS